MVKVILVPALLLFSGAATTAQVIDHATMDHRTMQREAGSRVEPVEAGHSAYAALGETVRILLADPEADWSAIDIDALRNHLVDMDNVTLRAQVSKAKLPNGARFQVSGQGPVVGSIHRMTQSHFAQPDFGRPWTMTVEQTAEGATVTVVSSEREDVAEIYGLGFFGILTMGAHHQPHHLMMARGGMRH